jgi:LysR family glycine cleavage system transcriptional activator
MRRIPSLRGLQAFDSVARSGSLAAAASAINITPSAVSHRLHGLEEELGVLLLRRTPKGLALTDEGRRYRAAVSQAFELIAKATDDLLGPDLSRPLTISMTSGFGMLWLMPRFHRFSAKHPEIEVAVLSSYRVFDLLAGEADIALRYGMGPWPGLRAETMLRFSASPLCAPRLMESIRDFSVGEALARSTLIHSAGDDWDDWLKAAGVHGIKPARRLRLDFPMALAAAIDAQGIVLGYSGYVEKEIASGLLVRPFDLTIPVKRSYHLVYAEERLRDPRVRAFRDWVMAESEIAE